MKSAKYLVKIRSSWILLAIAFVFSSVYAGARHQTKTNQSSTALTIDTDTRISVNTLDMFVSNFGTFAHDKGKDRGKNDGLYYPKGYPAIKTTLVYSAGIWIGAKVNHQPRIAVAEYSSEFAPGPMKNGTYQIDNASFEVYEIRPGDNAVYNLDYKNWPIAQGAPVDSEGKPLSLGDQTAWAVYNDADPSKHINNAGTTAPLGVEIQQTAFAFSGPDSLGRTIFMKFKIINKGANQLDSTFVSIWVDPDLGDGQDDLVGCDTLVSLGYCYNSGPDYYYGDAPPTVGIELLQGPIATGGADDLAYMAGSWRKGRKNLSIASFNRYINGDDPDTSISTYYYMAGLNRDGSPVINPATGQITKFACSGDPVSGAGWLDTLPSDKRFMLSSGPLTMAPGDTQEVVIAVLVGQGTDPISSVADLNAIARYARSYYVHEIQKCGDLDGSGMIGLSDILILVKYLFGIGSGVELNGPADLDCNQKVNLSDATFLVNYVFLGGPSPRASCSR